MGGAEAIGQNRFAFSAGAIPGAAGRARVHSTLTCRFTPRLQAGVEVTPLSTRERLNPLVNWLAVPEGAKTIPVIVGTVPIASARQVDRASTRRPARISSAGRSCRSLHTSGWPADPTGVTSE